jgi:hypothetical protein
MRYLIDPSFYQKPPFKYGVTDTVRRKKRVGRPSLKKGGMGYLDKSIG